MDQRDKNIGNSRLTNIYKKRFSKYLNKTSDSDKANKFATTELAIEIAGRIVTRNLNNITYDQDLKICLLHATRDAVRIFY